MSYITLVIKTSRRNILYISSRYFLCFWLLVFYSYIIHIRSTIFFFHPCLSTWCNYLIKITGSSMWISFSNNRSWWGCCYFTYIWISIIISISIINVCMCDIWPIYINIRCYYFILSNWTRLIIINISSYYFILNSLIFYISLRSCIIIIRFINIISLFYYSSNLISIVSFFNICVIFWYWYYFIIFFFDILFI